MTSLNNGTLRNKWLAATRAIHLHVCSCIRACAGVSFEFSECVRRRSIFISVYLRRLSRSAQVFPSFVFSSLLHISYSVDLIFVLPQRQGMFGSKWSQARRRQTAGNSIWWISSERFSLATWFLTQYKLFCALIYSANSSQSADFVIQQIWIARKATRNGKRKPRQLF